MCAAMASRNALLRQQPEAGMGGASGGSGGQKEAGLWVSSKGTKGQ